MAVGIWGLPLMSFGFADESIGATPMIAGEAENGQTVNLTVGASLDIVLAGNPTTGYQWELESGDTAVVQSLGEPDYSVDSQLMGAGGKYTFHFKAVAPGQATVKLIYHRVFDKAIPPIKTYTLTISVPSP